MMRKILVIGANGQLGTALVPQLQDKYGISQVIASDLRPDHHLKGKFERMDATDFHQLKELVGNFNIGEIYHLAAILSAKGEESPLKTWEVNMKTLFNVLEVSRQCAVKKVFFPSSIGVFGIGTNNTKAEQLSPLHPSTVYGISKAAGENWCNYYFEKYGLDVRSIRYPGVIGYQSMPGGGTTDYAVDIYHHAVREEPYECFLDANTMLPMIFMDDAIQATMKLMEVPATSIQIRTSYNISGMSFSPRQLSQSIRSIYPNFQVTYKPDFRQAIADSWPKNIDDSMARKDWGWKPSFDLDSMTKSMTYHLQRQYENQVIED